MSELSGIYAIWHREVSVFLRQKSRLLPAIVVPLLFLFVFGISLSASLGPSLKLATSYQAFILPGVLMMSLLFSSVFFGINIVWDKRLGFLKEVFATPISRNSIFLGKALGGMTNSIIQIIAVLIIVIIAVEAGVLKGVIITPLSVLIVFLAVVLAAASLVGIGLIIGALSSTPVDDVVRSFLLIPMMFLSGSLFPLNDLPHWLFNITLFDPLTYFVDLSRAVLLGASQFNPFYSGAIIIVFTAVIMGIGFYVFNKIRV